MPVRIQVRAYVLLQLEQQLLRSRRVGTDLNSQELTGRVTAWRLPDCHDHQCTRGK